MQKYLRKTAKYCKKNLHADARNKDANEIFLLPVVVFQQMFPLNAITFHAVL